MRFFPKCSRGRRLRGRKIIPAWTALPGAPSPATIVSAFSLALYKLVHTAARAAFTQCRPIISLSCLKCASSFPFPLGWSPDILSLPKEPWWTEPACILELATRYLPLAPCSSKEGLCSVLPVPSQDGACLRALAPLPSWREEAPALRSFSFSLYKSQCPPHFLSFIPFCCLLSILMHIELFICLLKSVFFLSLMMSPRKQGIVYCVHCWPLLLELHLHRVKPY